MKQIIREYFTFNKREKNGIAVLVCILLLLVLCIHYSDKFVSHPTVDFSKFEKQIQALNASEEKEATYRDGSEKNAPSIQLKAEIAYFNFDPNNLPEQTWKKFGLSDKQIRAIKNYEAKGGTFHSKADVKKMYSISPSLYAALEPYIQIPEKQISESDQKTYKHPSKINTVEINSADSVQLSAIKGIGPFFAKTIIRYRNLLGGFYRKEQLMEVWKLDEEKYKAIEKYITVDSSMIIKININTCTSKELKHPYLNWKIVNGIITYREKHGDFYTINDIKKTDLIDSELFSKMAPYLKSKK